MFDLVTGGAGFIGSHLVDALLKKGRKVRVVDNLSTGNLRNIKHNISNENFEFIEGDICDESLMVDMMEGADRVFHLAALADIVPSIENPTDYYRSNVDGTFSVLQAAKKHNIKKLVYVASSSSYGIPDTYPTPESSLIQPQYPYALTKWMGECLVMHWAKVYDLPAVSLRFFNIYGPRSRTNGTYGAVFGVFLAQILAGKPLTIVGDGTQKRDFTYVEDAVSALISAAESDVVGECMNVGSDDPISVNDLVKLLKANNTVNIPKRPGEPDCTWADTSKIKKLLDWKSKVSISKGVQKILDNINYWKDAPVWTPEKIESATKTWFKYLGK
tara:strand:- start:12435 stop:13424 length:990 start_codon:yes stop_codon:yes gene_type:complete